MVGKERSLEILTEEIEDYLPDEKHKDYEDAVDRVCYEYEKIKSKKPNYHKGKRVADWYTCGQCGRNVDIVFDFCPLCGFKIKWDSPRTLTR